MTIAIIGTGNMGGAIMRGLIKSGTCRPEDFICTAKTDATLDKIVLSNAQGQNVPAIQKVATGLSSVEAMQMRLPNPNPFTTQVNIPYIVGQTGAHEVQLLFTNLAGMVVDSYSATQSFGEYTYTWKPAGLPEGVYFVTLIVDGKKMQTHKLIRVR